MNIDKILSTAIIAAALPLSAIAQTTVIGGTVGNGSITFGPTVSGVTYELLATGDLTGGTPFPTSVETYSGLGDSASTTQAISDPGAIGQDARFYQLSTAP